MLGQIENEIIPGSFTSRLIGSPSQWRTVSGATIQYGAGSVPTTLNSTDLIPRGEDKNDLNSNSECKI